MFSKRTVSLCYLYCTGHRINFCSALSVVTRGSTTTTTRSRISVFERPEKGGRKRTPVKFKLEAARGS